MSTFDIVAFVKKEKYKPFWRYLVARTVTRSQYKKQFSCCGYFQLFLIVIQCYYTRQNAPKMLYISSRNEKSVELKTIADIYMRIKNNVEDSANELYKFITAKKFRSTDAIINVSTIENCLKIISPCIIYHETPHKTQPYNIRYIQHFFTIVKKYGLYWVLTSWDDQVIISRPDAVQIDVNEFNRLINYLSNSVNRSANIDEFNDLMKKYFLSDPIDISRNRNNNNGTQNRIIPAEEGVQLLLNRYQSDRTYHIGIIPNYVTEICEFVEDAIPALNAIPAPNTTRRNNTRRSRRNNNTNNTHTIRSHNRNRSPYRAKKP